MKFITACLTVLMLGVPVQLLASDDVERPQTTKIMPYETAAPGQMLELWVDGLGDGHALTPSSDDVLRMYVVQDGARHRARIRSVSFAGSDPSFAKTYKSVLFTVPGNVQEGAATALVCYRGQESNEFKLQVVSRPRAPALGGVVIILASPMVSGDPRPAPPPAGPKPNEALAFRFERGEEASLLVSPLVDSDEVADAAIVVTLQQGSIARPVVARVVHRDEVRTPTVWMPPRSEVRFTAPEDLALGRTEMQVAFRLNGQMSEAATRDVMIVDAFRSMELPQGVVPRIGNLTPARVGLGQSFELSIDNRRSLEPDPARVVVILEQGTKRYELNPERNTALLPMARALDAPVLLITRLGQDVVGPVKVRVRNPARGDEAGLSDSRSLEIVNEVLAPEVREVREATDDDLEPLRRMWESARSRGYKFHHYDPKSRYVTIRAIGLDPNPKFVRILMEQENRTFTLADADVSLQNGDLTVVRLPEAIQPGLVRMTIQNRGGDRFSEPVTKEFEVTRPRVP